MFNNRDEDPKSFDNTEKMPIFVKAKAILNLTKHIVEIISKEESDAKDDYDKEMLEHYGEFLINNASIIPIKIAGAEDGNFYDIKMENATIIRKAAKEILTDCTGLKMSGFREVDYLDLLRNEIEEFRILFAEWVTSFKLDTFIIDRWGLFNPPGINYNDIDPNDDSSFDSDDFLDE